MEYQLIEIINKIIAQIEPIKDKINSHLREKFSAIPSEVKNIIRAHNG